MYVCIDISRSAKYRGWLREYFQRPVNVELKAAEISIGIDVVLGVFHSILHIVGQSVQQKSHDEMVPTLSVKDMNDVR